MPVTTLRSVTCVAALVLAPALAFAQAAADLAEGKVLFNGLCVTCHGFEGAGGMGPPLNRPNLRSAPTDAELRTIISDGIPDRGMPRVRRVLEDELRQLVAYVRSLGRVARPPVKGNPQQGAQLYAKLGCAACHIVGGQGGSLGPELSVIGWLRGADYLRQAILEPAARLPQGTLPIPSRGYSEYLPVTVVMRDGREMRGVRLNEDVFTIQFRDGSGRFHSVRKSEAALVRKETATSLMPSYANRLAAAEADDLVAYLSTLGGAR